MVPDLAVKYMTNRAWVPSEVTHTSGAQVSGSFGSAQAGRTGMARLRLAHLPFPSEWLAGMLRPVPNSQYAPP